MNKLELIQKEKHIRELLKQVLDPEVEVNIVDLGLIYEVKCIDEDKVYVKMTFSTPSCPIGDVIVMNVMESIKNVYEGIEVDVDIVFDPLWNPEMISDEGKAILNR